MLSSVGHEGPGITVVVLLEGVDALVDDVVALAEGGVALAEGVVALAEGGVALAEGVVALVDGVNAGNAISKDCVHADCLYVCVCVSVLVLCV